MPTTVLNTLKKYGIDTSRPENPLLYDKGWLEEQYLVKQRTYEDIGNEIGVTKYGVYHAMKRFGITAREHSSKYIQLNDKGWLRQKYIDEKMSVPDLAKLVGCSIGAVYSSLTHAGIKTRNHKEGWDTKFPDGRLGEESPNWQGGISDYRHQCIGYKNRPCKNIVVRKGAKRCKSCSSMGEASPWWRGGITGFRQQIRALPQYFAWRKAVFERDNYACQWPECTVVSKDIQADHIKSFAEILNEYDIKTVDEALACKELWYISNGRTLCQPHHAMTETYGRPSQKNTT